MNAGARHLAALLVLAPLAFAPAARAESQGDEARRIIELSQAALGRRPDDLALVAGDNVRHTLHEFLGRPVVVSLVFTSCVHACSITTRHLERIVRQARTALGTESFTVLTIGFDTVADTPEAMATYARRHGIGDANWHVLGSNDEAGMRHLMDQLGFVSRPSPRGFDHTVQLSVLDQDGIVYRQVYGEVFEPPLLIEPLKDLVLGRPAPDAGLWTRLEQRVRLYCTVYDPASGRYYFDYSLFVGMIVGALVIGAVALWAGYELRAGRRGRSA